MAVAGPTTPFSDGSFVPAQSVDWVAKNVFLVLLGPPYARRVSCELSAVDVPRIGSADFTAVIQHVLRRVNRSSRVLLRQDLYSRFPVEGYGDVHFLLDGDEGEEGSDVEEMDDAVYDDATPAVVGGRSRWGSLQVELLRAGVARVVRPISVGLRRLQRAEARGVSRPRQPPAWSPWGKIMVQRERGPRFRQVWMGRVFDVLRGDVLCVQWEGAAAATTAAGDGSAVAQGDGAHHLLGRPTLVLLDGVRCEPVQTSVGYAALRASQRIAMHRRVTVRVCALHPSDVDVSLNTQMSEYEQLFRAAGEVILHPAEGTDPVLAERDGAMDWLPHGLRRSPGNEGATWSGAIQDAASPTATMSTTSADGAASASASAAPAAAAGPAAATGLNLGRFLVQNDLAKVVRVMDAAVPRAPDFFDLLGDVQRLTVAAGDGTDAPSPSSSPSLLEVWRRCLWGGDALESEKQILPWVHYPRPLRFQCAMEYVAQSDTVLYGYIRGATIEYPLSPSTPSSAPPRRFLRVEMATVVGRDDAIAVANTERSTLTGLGEVEYSPTPAPRYVGHSLSVSLRYEPLLSGIAPEKASIQSICTIYPLFQFDPITHKPRNNSRPGSMTVVPLSLPATIPGADFVLDVTVTFADRCDELHSRAVFTLLRPEASEEGSAMAQLNQEFGNFDEPGFAELDIDEEFVRAKGRTDAVALTVDDAIECGAPSDTFGADSVFFHATVDVYFELQSKVVADEEERRFLDTVDSRMKAMQYIDAVLVPTGIACINGRRGFLGDVLLPQSRTWHGAPQATSTPLKMDGGLTFARRLSSLIPGEFTESLLTGPQSCGWWCREGASGDAAGGQCIADAVREALQRRQRTQDDAPRALDLAASDVGESAPAAGERRAVLHVTVGDPVLWVDTFADADPADQVPPYLEVMPSRLPPTVPLFTLSLFPRQLIASHSDNVRAVVVKKVASPAALKQGLDHVDAAFMRLKMRRLPCMVHMNLERMPLILRNVERAFCNDVQRQHARAASERLQEAAAAAGPSAAPPRKAGPPEGSSLYTTAVVFSQLLAMLLLLTPRSPSDSETFSLLSAARGRARVLSTNAFKAVLYKLTDDHPRVLFLGTRSSRMTDLFERRHSLRTFSSLVAARVVEGLGLSSMLGPADSKSPSWSPKLPRAPLRLTQTPPEECYPMGTLHTTDCDATMTPPLGAAASLRQQAASDYQEEPRHMVFHPLPWLSVLGLPLAIRNEVDHLHDPNGARSDPANLPLARRYVAVDYATVLLPTKKIYKLFSYGQVVGVESNLVRNFLKKRAENGKNIADYFSLLLRRPSSRHDTPFADGVLRAFGVPLEPLLLHYVPRRALRLEIALEWGALRSGNDWYTDSEPAEVPVVTPPAEPAAPPSAAAVESVAAGTWYTEKVATGFHYADDTAFVCGWHRSGSNDAAAPVPERLNGALDPGGLSQGDVVEANVLVRLCHVARALIRTIEAKVLGPSGHDCGDPAAYPYRALDKFYLTFSTACTAKNRVQMFISVFPITDAVGSVPAEQPVDSHVSCGDNGLADDAADSSPESLRSAHRPFELEGNVFGRLAAHQLHVEFKDGQYMWRWESTLEREGS